MRSADTTSNLEAARPDRSGTMQPLAGYVLALAGAALAVLAAVAAERWLGLRDPSVVFMLAVMLIATQTRTGPALLAALLCFLSYNFFFIEPRHTLHVRDRHAVVLLLLFLVAASLAGRLASRLAMQVQALRRAQHRAAARQRLAQQLASATDAGTMSGAASTILRETFDAEAWIRIGDDEGRGANEASLSVLRRSGDGPGHHRETPEQHGWWFLPLQASEATLGAVGLKFAEPSHTLDEDEREAVRELVHDLAQALLRLRLATALEHERVRSEAERLRSALLSSVSHDLRTPLASILGAAETLEGYGEAMPDEDRIDLLAMIRGESERLDRYIRNLLDMTRLGPGAPPLRRDWIGVDELLGAALARVRRQHPDARFELAIDPALGPVHLQPALIEQALLNIVENAVKFSPPDAPVLIRVQRGPEGAAQITIVDRGPGIPEAERERIFDLFYSVARGDRGREGTGLGLAISRAAILAHGGEIEARAGTDGHGTEVAVRLPVPDAPEDSS